MHLMGGRLPPCRRCVADFPINAAGNFWSRMLQLSIPFFLEDTPGCLTQPQILYRAKVFILMAVSSRKESVRIRHMYNPFISPKQLWPNDIHANFCRFLTCNFGHISPLKKLDSQKIGDSLLQTGCFVFHIHLPLMTFSSKLLSPQVKTQTRRQAQISICKSSCALSAVCQPPGPLRDLLLSLMWVWTALWVLWRSQLPF